MKNYLFTLLIICCFLFSSFTVIKPCEYAGSNINFVKTQTQTALELEDLNIAKYHIYKAIKAIEKTKAQLSSCGCDYAAKSIEDSFRDLVLATKATTIESVRILLQRSLEKTIGSLDALEKHELHNSKYASDILSINTQSTNNTQFVAQHLEGSKLESKIDSTLLKYETSLFKIVNTVNCKEALQYATKIYEHCEQQLLKENLSEGKKYYNLRTKEITATAIEKLKDCKN